MDKMDLDFDEKIIIKEEDFPNDVVSPSHIEIPDLVSIVQNDNGEAEVIQTWSNNQDSVLISKVEQRDSTEQFAIDIPPLVTVVRNPNGRTVVQKFIDPADQNTLTNKQKTVQQKICSCFLCTLFTTGASAFTANETNAHIKMGRPTPKLDQNINKKNRSRNFIRKLEPPLYNTYPWLTACLRTKKLYCWSCLLFQSIDKTSILHRGMIDLQTIHTCLKWHGNLESHLGAHLQEKVVASKLAKDDVNSNANANQHNELVAKNRNVLKRLIDVISFRAGYTLTPRGPKNDQDHESVVLDLIKLIAACDPTLIEEIEAIPRLDLPSIYNTLETCICDVAIKEIKSEIRNVNFVSFIFYDVLDNKSQSHIAAVVRYIKYMSGKPVAQNRFLSYVDVPPCDRTADVMTKITSDLVISLDCKEKIISQSYCGASILPKHLNIVQTRIREAYPTALYVYCSGFKMCEIIVQSLGLEIDVCKEFFAELKGISELFLKYPKLEESLKVHIDTVPLTLEINREFFKEFAKMLPHTLKIFRQVIQESELWNHEVVNACRGYVVFLETDKRFHFLLWIFADIFSHVDDVAAFMKSKPYDITKSLQKVNHIVKELEKTKLLYGKYISESLFKDNYEPVRKKGPSTDFKDLCSNIIDNILTQFRAQLRNYKDLEFMKYCNFAEGQIMTHTIWHYMADSYQAIFDEEALDSQFRTILRSTEVDLDNSPGEMLSFLRDNELDEAFSEVAKLIELILTIPCGDGGSNSQLAISLEGMAKNIKSCDDKKMAFLATERSLIQQLSQNPTFYEDVFNLFVTANDKVKLNFK